MSMSRVVQYHNFEASTYYLELDGDASLGVHPCQNEVEIRNDDGAVLRPH
jgi:hypothetical protein